MGCGRVEAIVTMRRSQLRLIGPIEPPFQPPAALRTIRPPPANLHELRYPEGATGWRADA